MNFKPSLNGQQLQEEISQDEDIEISPHDECSSNDLEGFEEVRLDSSVLQRPKRVPDIWSGPKVPLLLAFMEEIGPKVKNSLRFSNKNKAWQEIQRRLEMAGFSMTVKQITNKYCGLVRQYKAFKKQNKKKGRHMKCPFEREIERVRAVWPRCMRESHSENDLMQKDGDCECNEESRVFCCWSNRRVQFLLSCIEDLLPKIGNSPEFKRKMQMWQEIVRRFGEKGCEISMLQVTNKFGSLLRQYRLAQARNKHRKNKPLTCAFKEEIERIIAIQKVARCNIMNNNDNYDDISYTTDSNDEDNDAANYSENNTGIFGLETNHGFSTESFEEKSKLKEIRSNYYKERMEYYQRRKLHLQRKEEHMRRKEALLEAILSQIEFKNEEI